MRSWGLLGGSWGALGGVLEGSGTHLGPKRPQELQKTPTRDRGTPEEPLAWEGSWGPKSTKIDQKSIKNVINFFINFLIDF